MPPAPAVSSRCSGQSSDSASASAITAAARSSAGSTAPPSLSAEPGCSTTACAPERRAGAQRRRQRGERLLAEVRVLGGAVEQVDGVDQQRVDVGVRHRRAEVGDLLVGVLARLPLARVLVEDLDRARAALDAALDGLRRTAGGGDVDTDQHGGRAVLACCPDHARPLRSLADRRPAHRRRPHGALQLAARARPRAASWCCGSRTPTASARRPRTSSRSSRRCAGSSSTGTASRSSSRSAPTATPRSSSSCSPAATPTAPPPGPTRCGRSRRRTATAASAARTRGPARCGCACPTRARRPSSTSSAARRSSRTRSRTTS